MSHADARQIINTEGREHTVIVRFTKRDGSPRRMVCRYFGQPSRKAHLMHVWDIEKGAVRTVNLDTVQDVKVLGSASHSATERTFEEVQAEMDQYFA